MRRIGLGPIALFGLLSVAAAGVAWIGVLLLLSVLPPGDFRGVLGVCSFGALFLVAAIVEDRLLLALRPLPEGDLPEGSPEEFTWSVHVLFYLVVFNSLIRTRFLPVPVMSLVYRALGTCLGPNSYTAGTLLDPPLTSVGSDTLLGQDSIVYAHAIEGRRLALARVAIGSGVTVGANTVLMAGVRIGDRSIVGAGSVVAKGTVIGSDEVWGGVPARKLRDATPSSTLAREEMPDNGGER